MKKKPLRPKSPHLADPADWPGIAGEFERECVEFFGEIVKVLRVPRSLGQIYGLLFASPRPLTFTEIVRLLGISKGSASQGLQLLRTFGAVRTAPAGDEGPAGTGGKARRERFEPELGLRRMIAGLLRERIEPLLTKGGGNLRRMRACSRRTASGLDGPFYVQRMRRLDRWRGEMRILLPLLRSIVESASA